MTIKTSKISDIGSIVINFLRPEATIKCLDSLMNEAPGIKIYVGDQDRNKMLEIYCKEFNITYVPLKFDFGISASRNKLVEYIKQDKCKFVMWGDNDFVYDSRLRLENSLKILDKDSKVGIVGGTILKNTVIQHYERIIYYNQNYKTACFIPLEYTYPEPRYAENIDYYYCDMTFNFCVARVNIFNKNVKWDDEIKVKYEHSMFFLKFLQHSPYRVVYCPSIMVKHEHEPNEEYKKYRYRTSDEITYSKNLNLLTGMTVNDVSWDFTTQDKINFKEMTLKSQTYLSAINHAKTIVEPPKKPIEIIFCSKYQIVKKLLACCVSIIALKQTCLDIITNHQLNEDNNTLDLGVKSCDLTKLTDLLKSWRFEEVSENQFKYKYFIINIEPYSNITKPYVFQDINIKVPIPVIDYLNRVFGLNWQNKNE